MSVFKEEEPSIEIELTDRTVEANPYNTTLFTYLGKTAVENGTDKVEVDNHKFNHIWVQLGDEEGLHIFEAYDKEQFDTLSRFMIVHSYPQIINMRDIAAIDVQAWLRRAEQISEQYGQNIPDFIPE